MSSRGYLGFPVSSPEAAFDALGHEILSEKAASLGRAGAWAKICVDRLRLFEGEDQERDRVRKAAVEAVHAYFIQRELCGFRRHDDVIRDLEIPRAVLARLGAR